MKRMVQCRIDDKGLAMVHGSWSISLFAIADKCYFGDYHFRRNSKADGEDTVAGSAGYQKMMPILVDEPISITILILGRNNGRVYYGEVYLPTMGVASQNHRNIWRKTWKYIWVVSDGNSRQRRFLIGCNVVPEMFILPIVAESDEA